MKRRTRVTVASSSPPPVCIYCTQYRHLPFNGSRASRAERIVLTRESGDSLTSDEEEKEAEVVVVVVDASVVNDIGRWQRYLTPSAVASSRVCFKK